MANACVPTCPYCGHVERDAWEIDFGQGLDGDTEHTCHSCGEDYFLIREVTVRYASHKLDRKHQAATTSEQNTRYAICSGGAAGQK